MHLLTDLKEFRSSMTIVNILTISNVEIIIYLGLVTENFYLYIFKTIMKGFLPAAGGVACGVSSKNGCIPSES